MSIFKGSANTLHSIRINVYVVSDAFRPLILVNSQGVCQYSSLHCNYSNSNNCNEFILEETIIRYLELVQNPIYGVVGLNYEQILFRLMVYTKAFGVVLIVVLFPIDFDCQCC